MRKRQRLASKPDSRDPLRRAPSERAKPLPPTPVDLIRRQLGTLPEMGLKCFTCQTGSLSGVTFHSDHDQLPDEVTRLTVTECDSCGDVRLYGVANYPEENLELRGHLDLLAAVLSDCVPRESDFAAH